MLKDIPFKRSYRTDRDDIAHDFLSQCLSEADYYDRAVGYFTSSVFAHFATGLPTFVQRKGLIRLIASPDLSEDDINAIRLGHSLRASSVHSALSRVVDEFEESPLAYATQLLTWLVARRQLHIRIAVPTDQRYGIYHEKIGIFRDARDSVAFSGSFNETGAAASKNFESVEVFASWLEAPRVQEKIADFEHLWNNTTAGLHVTDFPDDLAQRLRQLAPANPPRTPALTDSGLALRDYQNDAISAWTENKRCGILEMATGSGKTLTALSAAANEIERGLGTLVLLAPLKHLVDKWADDLTNKTGRQVVRCFSEYDWRSQMATRMAMARLDKGLRPIILASTYSTAQTDDFTSALSRAPQPRMLIADEVHNVTPESADSVLLGSYDYRLGLSATPARFNDPAGSQRILDYFHNVVYSFDLAAAINGGFLAPYDYFPIVCELTPVETVEYDALKTHIAEEKGDRDSQQRSKRLEALLRLRHRLIQRSADKLSKFEQLIRDGSFDEQGFNLVYCHYATIDLIQNFLGREMHYKTHTFTARESMPERKDILRRFASGDLKFLAAIRCLDEGVDIPATRTAFLLNSSRNPKEFIQRRGRVLRTHEGKEVATIYDFVVLPTHVDDIDRDYVNAELSRFYEFAALARNRNTASHELETIARSLGIGSLPSLFPASPTRQTKGVI